MKPQSFTVQELADRANTVCRSKGIRPLSGQASADLSVRNIRYYQGLGLLDAPTSKAGRGYNDLHLEQLVRIRALQAQGLPLAHIRSRLTAHESALPETKSFVGRPQWEAVRIASDIFLLVQEGERLTPAKREQILEILRPHGTAVLRETEQEDGFRPETD